VLKWFSTWSILCDDAGDGRRGSSQRAISDEFCVDLVGLAVCGIERRRTQCNKPRCTRNFASLYAVLISLYAVLSLAVQNLATRGI
jgi:hypothetical protein